MGKHDREGCRVSSSRSRVQRERILPRNVGGVQVCGDEEDEADAF